MEQVDIVRSEKLPYVVLISLGGTIAMVPGVEGGVVPHLDGDQLLAAVPGLNDLPFAVRAVSFRQLPSGTLGFADLLALVKFIDELIVTDTTEVLGIVITQGTDTIEETAYLLDIYYRHSQPLVVTGAMRSAGVAGADGPANLLAAVVCAGSNTLREAGTVVVFADEIHAANRVSKSHATAPHTFQSPNGGPLGFVVEGKPELHNRQVSPTVHLALPVGSNLPHVALLTATVGDDGALLEMLHGRVDALVVAGFGAGHVPLSWVNPLTTFACNIPVVLASRTGSGRVLSQTYGYPGSESDLLNRGLISAGWLSPVKARILLWSLVANQVDTAEIRRVFAGSY